MTNGALSEEEAIGANIAAEILGVSPRQAVHATADWALAAERRTVDLRETPQRVDETPQADEPRPYQPQEPSTPGHARPDDDGMGSEAPELPIEAFPDPSPNQPPQPAHLPPIPELPELPADPDPEWLPTGTPDSDMLTSAAIYQSAPAVVTRIVRVPGERRAGGILGWLGECSTIGPFSVWALPAWLG